MSTTQELRDYLKMTARPAQVEELVLVLNDLEAAEKRIAAALDYIGLFERVTINRLQAILEGK